MSTPNHLAGPSTVVFVTTKAQLTAAIDRAVRDAVLKALDEHEESSASGTRWVPTDEAVRLYGRKRSTLYRWRRAGLIRWNKIGGSVYYERPDGEEACRWPGARDET